MIEISINIIATIKILHAEIGGSHCRCRDRIIVGLLTTTNAISAHHLKSCEFKSCSLQGVLDKTLCDKFVSDSSINR